MDKTGILLINLGSPDAPRPREVRRYLREFLSDPRVIDIPAFARFLLLNLIILPFRPRRSAHAYAKIWTERGSPLVAHSRDLCERVTQELERVAPGQYLVRLAMRYGRPSIASALAEFRAAGVDRIKIAPLYPQYSTAATASSLDRVYSELRAHWNIPSISTLAPFFAHPGFLDPYARQAGELLRQEENAAGRPFDAVVFSFHGIPERHVTRADACGVCKFNDACCASVNETNRFCYRAHCFATARGLAQRMGLAHDRWMVTFQSRLGRTPWLKPYTDLEFAALPARGVKRLFVLSPAFVADCLETLEEINMQGRDTFLGAGGESFVYAPCLNSGEEWARGLAQILTE